MYVNNNQNELLNFAGSSYSSGCNGDGKGSMCNNKNETRKKGQEAKQKSHAEKVVYTRNIIMISLCNFFLLRSYKTGVDVVMVLR